jgi:hypothetical protein
MNNIVLRCDTPLEITEEQNKVRMTNKEHFTLLVIEPNVIKDKDWSHPDYLSNLVNDNFCQYIKVHPDDYIQFIGKYLEVEKYKEPYIKVEVIFEEKNYITEMMYIEVKKEDEEKYELNEFANLLNINHECQDKIFGNVIINRTYLSTSNNDMHLDDISPEKLQFSLYKRANTTVILYDSDSELFKEEEIFGPIDIYAEKFFEEKKYNIKKQEISFLKHVINIWYTEDEYGISNTIGKLIPSNVKIDKMIIFSMWNEDYRDSLYLSEFNKMILLSKKLDNFLVPEEYLKEEKDSLGRDIVKNKYKILDLIYINHI